MFRVLRAFRAARRASALLFVVLLSHTTWMAGSVACESGVSDVTADQARADGASGSRRAGGEAQTSPHAHHLMASAHASAHASAPTPPQHDTPASSPDCPMAMACATTAVVADVPTFSTHTVAVLRERTNLGTVMPQSARVAPETPPPRG